MKVEKIDHICIAVKNLQKAMEAYEAILGLDNPNVYSLPEEDINVARYYIGDVALERMEPTSPSGDVVRYIQKRGEGIFLISYTVSCTLSMVANLLNPTNLLYKLKNHHSTLDKFISIVQHINATKNGLER